MFHVILISVIACPDTQVQIEDGADGLPYTKTIGRLNVAVTDGNSAIAARYVCSDPTTAHSLYYTKGSNIEYKGKKCCVSKCAQSKTYVTSPTTPY